VTFSGTCLNSTKWTIDPGDGTAVHTGNGDSVSWAGKVYAGSGNYPAVLTCINGTKKDSELIYVNL
jgi:hypothetical protein